MLMDAGVFCRVAKARDALFCLGSLCLSPLLRCLRDKKISFSVQYPECTSKWGGGWGRSGKRYIYRERERESDTERKTECVGERERVREDERRETVRRRGREWQRDGRRVRGERERERDERATENRERARTALTSKAVSLGRESS